ncbi:MULTISPECIES: glycosyltransferase family 2 protein [unclassified Xanthomonas]|uniref:glycosyltransferase family 2 protein n=1 Tax=Xanthomonas sp. LMG 9002 TaxID=1591158 RepID=UPI00136F99B1|nr:glycosyltransferase family A protein [Xanthomonas sp. LMG 9002]MXV08174.1 glycosyltransferase family 2 protein [Xanthomonas sp. LMG 9002]
MRAFVFDGRGSTLDEEDALLLQARLASEPSDSLLVIIGEDRGQLRWRNRVSLNVDADAEPGSSPERFPTLASSNDDLGFYRSTSVMRGLRALDLHVRATYIEFPIFCGIAFSTLQARLLNGGFAGATIAVRLNRCSALESIRRARPLCLADLRLMDLERKALRDCDLAVCLNSSISSDFCGALGLEADDLQERLACAVVQAPCAIDMAGSVAVNDFVCVSDEPQSLRTVIRGFVGLCRQNPRWRGGIRLDMAAAGADLALVPADLRGRVRQLPSDWSKSANSTTVAIFANRWAPAAMQVIETASNGVRCVVNAANPALREESGWKVGHNVLAYNGEVTQLLDALAQSLTWRPSLGPPALPVWPLRDGSDSREEATFEAPRVTVVVTHFNLGEYIGSTLASVWSSSYPNLDVLVVDDASTDEASRSTLRRLEQEQSGRLRVVWLPYNIGLSAARNVGVLAASGDYVLALDADDIISPAFIELAVAALQRNREFDFVVPKAAYFTSMSREQDFNSLEMKYVIPLLGEGFWSGRYMNSFSTATCLARRAVVAGLRYREDLRAYEDWEFYRRALSDGHRFIVTPDVHFLYRQRPGSMIHSADMRRRHACLVMEMVPINGAEGGLASLQPIIAPEQIPGSAFSGLLLSELEQSLSQLNVLRRLPGFSLLIRVLYRLARRVPGHSGRS